MAVRSPERDRRGARLRHVPAAEGNSLLDGRMQLKVSAAETNEAYTLCLGLTPPGLGPPLHVHALDDQTHYVLAGTYELICGPEVAIAGPGACVHMPRYTPHTFRNVGDEPAVLIEFTAPGGIDRYFDAVAHLGPVALDVDARNDVGRPYGISFPDGPEDYLEPPAGELRRATTIVGPGEGSRIAVSGHEALRKLGASDTGGSHSLTEVSLPANATVSLDDSRQVVFVCLEGTFSVAQGGERAEAEVGDTIAAPAGDGLSVVAGDRPAKLVFYALETG